MSEKRELTIAEIMKFIDEADVKEEREKIETKLKLLKKYTAWSEENYTEYDILLEILKKEKRKSNSSTKIIGKALEDLVTFIFEKSYFYKVHPNKRTGTNEIDQFVILSDKGKQAIADYNFSADLLVGTDKYFLCECKNYKEKVAATWIGKFNTLLKVSGDCTLGIIFSCEGLTGSENNWYDAHGLTKIIYRMSDESRRIFILDFNMKDFERLKKRDTTIFSIIDSKKNSLVSNIKSTSLLHEKTDGKEEVEKIYNELDIE